MIDRLEEGLKILGINHEKKILDTIETYWGELRLFNKSLKLVGDPETLWLVRHILDSLAPFPILMQKPFATVADLGSGAGLPGLLMSLFFPESKITLIERMGSRCAFLRNAAAIMELPNVEIREINLEDVADRYDLIVMRAFLPLGKIERDLRRIGGGGRVAAWKGRREILDEEISGLKFLPKPEQIISYKVPFLTDERNLVLFEL